MRTWVDRAALGGNIDPNGYRGAGGRTSNLGRAAAGDAAASRTAIGVAGGGIVERETELRGEGRQPREHVTELVQLLVGRALANRLRQLAEFLSQPGDCRRPSA